MSTSMPIDVHAAVVASIPGLESAEMILLGYAIEYDAIDPRELRHTLEVKSIRNLFITGQINGKSGYEKAACQGRVARINAACRLGEIEEVRIARTEGYTGILIDDLVTKGADEPYRMFTSRAEFRLHLRIDNADERLTPLGFSVGTIQQKDYDAFVAALEGRRAFFRAMGATATDHAVVVPRTTLLSAAEVEALFQRARYGIATSDDQAHFEAHMLMEMARLSVEDGLVMQIHPGSYRNHNPSLLRAFGRDKGADLPLPTDFVRGLKPLLDRFGNDRRLTIILFPLDETTYSPELAPLAEVARGRGDEGGPLPGLRPGDPPGDAAPRRPPLRRRRAAALLRRAVRRPAPIRRTPRGARLGLARPQGRDHPVRRRLAAAAARRAHRPRPRPPSRRLEPAGDRRVGPLELAGFATRMPDRPGLQRLVSLVRAFLGFETGFAVNPVLAGAEVPPLRLDQKSDPAPRLGWNTWIPGSQPPLGTKRADAADALFEAEIVEAEERAAGARG